MRRPALFAVVAALVAAVGVSTPAAHAASGLVGPLRTVGNQIVDGHGAPVSLRGVNREFLDEYDYLGGASHLDDAYFALVKASGANIVRFPLGEQFWNQRECTYDAGYPAKVDQVVSWITSRGMVALLDLHHNTPLPCRPEGQQKMASDGRGVPNLGSVAFWKGVATRYKSNPLVAFDLYNEPHDLTWAQWRNGGLLTNNTPVYQAAGMQQLYDAVRATGANNLVVVSGNNWANTPPPTASLLTGHDIAYAVHYYSCPNLTQCPAEPSPVPDPLPALNAWNGLAASRPVLVTEFGWPWDDTAAYDQAVIGWAETHAAGWTAYQMTPHAATSDPFGWLTSWTSLAPTTRGQAIFDGLARNP